MKPTKLKISIYPKDTPRLTDGDVAICWRGEQPDLSDKPSEAEYKENLNLFTELNNIAHLLCAEMAYSDTGWAVDIVVDEGL